MTVVPGKTKSSTERIGKTMYLLIKNKIIIKIFSNNWRK